MFLLDVGKIVFLFEIMHLKKKLLIEIKLHHQFNSRNIMGPIVGAAYAREANYIANS